MTAARRLRRWTGHIATFVALAFLTLVLIAVLFVLLLQTPWAKDRIRALIVRQANDYLTAHLDIGHLEGSLFTNLTLKDVRLSSEGRTLVAIDSVSLAYNIREVWSRGVVIDRLRLVSPRVTATKRADGHWDLASLVRKTSQEQQRKGPGRAVHMTRIEIDDGTIALGTPVAFGAVHIPSRYEHLNTWFSFDYVPVRWTLRFVSMSWSGADPELRIDSLIGALGNGPAGFAFDRLVVRTRQGAFTVNGLVRTERKPTTIDLDVHADRFAFQEWSGIIHGLRNIAVESQFDVALHGPVTAMATDLGMRSTGGTIDGRLTLDTSVPGWIGRGALDIARLNLATWLNRSDRPSDITGHVAFDLALRLGEGFPRGRYDFRGPHAGFMEYAADNVTARGDIDATQVFVRYAAARAYGADVTTAGAIAIDDPFPFRFAGTAARLDLRRVPKSVPVPHVESLLSFDYDVRGRFAKAFVAGHARLATSTFLGATIAEGTVGTIDTSAHPLEYSGDGQIANVDLARFGQGLEIRTLLQPRYRGRVSGRFALRAAGTNARELNLHATGRLFRADAFDGTLGDADVTLDIENGTLAAAYDGRFDRVDPSIPLLDPRFEGSLSGSGRVAIAVRDLMLRTPAASDYDIDWNLTFQRGRVRSIDLDAAHAVGEFRGAITSLTSFDVSGPAATIHATGALAFTGEGSSNLSFVVDRADLARVGGLTGARLDGQLTARGRLTGPWALPHVSGDATFLDLDVPGVHVMSGSGDYDFDVPAGDRWSTTARVAARGDFLSMAGRSVPQVEGTLALANRAVDFRVTAREAPGRTDTFDGRVRIGGDAHSVTIDRLAADVGARWSLAATRPPPIISWNQDVVTIQPLSVTGGVTGAERIDVGGSWRPAGGGDLRLAAERVHLESFQDPKNVRYAGIIDADLALSGTRALPIVTGTLAIADGRVGRFAYQRVAGRVDYAARTFTIDFRLDQSPGVWATAKGRLPLAMFDRALPEAPIDVQIASSRVQLGLLNGLTNVVTNVSGDGIANVHTVGTSRDPHFEGRVELSNAAFIVSSSGVAYSRGAAQFALARDRITVESLHVEDASHNTLDLHGSLGTHELKVGALQIQATAHEFTVLRNELGRVAVDASLDVTGRFEAPTIEGNVTITSGSLNVDEILEQTVFRPYSTQETKIAPVVDAIAALNPWDRLRVNLTLHVPDTLRLAGQNVQVSPGTPIGFGDISLRVGGDLALLKDPGQGLATYGSFDTITGTFTFQGRRFDVLQTSSINFRGGFSPELYVNVAREINGVEARVLVSGPLSAPELHLSSTPPLETADVLSLIVFNTSLNDLNAVQQQQLAVRAGTLAAGFLATPLVSALQTAIGLDVLELQTSGDYTTPGTVAPKLTIGEEIAPGLFARFSQQFGENEYSQVEIQYYLTRILQIRATFSDAASLNLRAPFRRIERGGIDLLLFFSF